MLITNKQITELIGSTAYTRATLILASNAINHFETIDSTNQIMGVIKGTASRPYEITIDLEADLNNECSCPVGFDCKHVGALLLKYMLTMEKQTHTNIVAPQKPEQINLSEGLESWFKYGLSIESHNKNKEMVFFDAFIPKYTKSGLIIKPYHAQILKSGELSKTVKAIALRNFSNGHLPEYLTDHENIVPLLMRLPMFTDHGIDTYEMKGKYAISLLKDIIKTGLCFYDYSKNGFEKPLKWGETFHSSLVWLGIEADKQKLTLETPKNWVILAMNPLVYFDENNQVLGEIETGIDADLAYKLLQMPLVNKEQVNAFSLKLHDRLNHSNELISSEKLEQLLPKGFKKAIVVKEPLNVVLRLFAEPIHRRIGGYWSNVYEEKLTTMARLEFHYGKFQPLAFGEDGIVQETINNELYKLDRNLNSEKKAISLLRSAKLDTVSNVFDRYTINNYNSLIVNKHHFVIVNDITTNSPLDWVEFIQHDMPLLNGLIDVVIEESFPYSIHEYDGDFSAKFEEGSGIDWFNLELGIDIQGEKIDLVPMFLDLIKNITQIEKNYKKKNLDSLNLLRPDGKVIVVAAEKIMPVLRAFQSILMLGELKEEKISVSKKQVTDLAILEEFGGFKFEGAEVLRKLGKKIREGGIQKVNLPSNFKADLRPYQMKGVQWLQFLREIEMGGILADDMGLGKTVQTLAHIAIEKDANRLKKPILVICPTSLVANWRMEVEKFAPHLKVLPLRGNDRKELFDEIKNSDIVLSTYPLLSRDQDILLAQEWQMVILDEAQAIKNPISLAAKTTQQLKAEQRILLTGTPMENHLGELWSLFNMILPGFLEDQKSFTKKYRTPIEKMNNKVIQKLLAKRVQPFMLRRGKELVAKELPPKTEMPEHVELEGAQKHVYDSVRMLMNEKVRAEIAKRGLKQSTIVILDALLKLRQICCDPRLLLARQDNADVSPLSKVLITDLKKASSAKLQRLIEMLPQLIEEGRKILLFSQFTSMLAILQEELVKLKINFVLLQGDTKDRETPIRRFQNGEVPLFLISLKAGGVGLNLTAADTVIHYDPWWNPAVENQATDRAHRIGQTKPVFVHKMIALGTIEEKMEGLKLKKANLAAGIFDLDGKTTLDLTENDILDLFG